MEEFSGVAAGATPLLMRRSRSGNAPVLLLHAGDIVLQLFDDALLAGNLILHLLQLHEQLALCRSRGRSPCPGIGAARAITRRRIATCVVIYYRNLSPSRERQAEREDGYSTTAHTHKNLLTQFYATVLSPGLLVVAGGNWTLFAVGNQFQLSRETPCRTR